MEDWKALIDIFLEKNSQINLSAIRDPEGVYVKHILDSLVLTELLDLGDYDTLVDIGTGGGFPLLPLAKFAQDNDFGLALTGLDTRRKKTHAVQDMADQLGLNNIQTVWTRAEEHHQHYDIITSRAVAYAKDLIPRVIHMMKSGSILVLYKQKNQEEHQEILRQASKYDLEIIAEYEYSLFEGDIERVVYLLEK